MKRTVDNVDAKILHTIQEFGQKSPLTQVEIGKAIGREKTPTRERLMRLREDGFVRSWSAILDPDRIEVTFTAYVLVTLNNHSKDDLAEFRKIIQDGYYVRKTENNDEEKVDISRIMECYSVTGNADFLLRVVATDKKNFAIFIEEELLDIPIVGQVNSMIVLREVKYTTEYPQRFLKRLVAKQE